MSANVSKIDVILNASQAIGEAKRVEQSFAGVQKAAASAGVSGAAGLNQLERAALANRATMAQNRVAIEQNKAEVERLTASMRVLEGQNQKSSASYVALEAELAAVTAQMQALKATQGQLGAETAVLTTTKQVLKTELDASAGAFDKLTSRISVGRGILGGYDQAVEGVVRAMGGIKAGWAVAIGLASALLPKIIELITAKKALVEIDEKQVAVDIVSAQLGGNQTRVMADLITSFRNVTAETDSYQKKTEQLNKAFDNLITKGGTSYFTLNAYGQQVEVNRNDTERLQGTISKLNSELAEQDKKIKPAIESLKLLQRSYGLNDEQLASLAEKMRLFDTSTEAGRKTFAFFKTQIDADLPGLEALASVLAKNTDRMYGLERAAYQTAIAIQQIKPPNLNLGAFANPQDANDRLRQAAATAVIGGEEAGRPLKSDIEIFNAIRPELEAVKKSFLDTAAALGKNQAETKALFNSYVSQLDPMYQQWIARLKTVADNQQAFTDKTKQTANATSNLQKELEQANASVSGITEGSFEERRKKESAIYDDRIRDLKRNNQATQENLDLARQIYQVHYEKIKQDSIKAYLDIQNRLEAIQGKGLDSEVVRHEAMIDKLVKDDVEAMRKAGLDKNQITAFTILFRKAREEEFNAWLIEQNNKTLRTMANAENQLAKEVADIKKRWAKESQASTLSYLKEQFRSEKQQMAEVEQLRKQLLSKARPGGLTDDQSFKLNLDLDADIKKLDALGLSANDVDKYFGSASHSVQQFHDRVDLLTSANASAIESLSQMVDWSAVLTSGIQAFTSAIAGAIAGTDSLGQALLVGFFNIIGMIAIQLGTLFILAAAGFAFIPGLNWSAGALAAAGIAMLAFGAVMTGLAAKFSQKDHASGSAGASGGASSGTGATKREPPTNVISFPTSGSASSGGMMVSLTVDRNMAKDLIEGKELVMMADLRGHGSRSPEVRRSVRKMSKQVA